MYMYMFSIHSYVCFLHTYVCMVQGESHVVTLLNSQNDVIMYAQLSIMFDNSNYCIR